MELKTKEAKENRRTSQAKEQARWNRENKLQWRNHNNSQLLRALSWRRLKLLSDHRTSNHEGWLRWTYDTGAANSAFSLDAKIGTETQANGYSYKTASGDLISDRGGMRVQGTVE